MDNNYQSYKEEVEKINQKIQEYLWNKQNPFKTAISKFTNVKCRFLARQK